MSDLRRARWNLDILCINGSRYIDRSHSLRAERILVEIHHDLAGDATLRSREQGSRNWTKLLANAKQTIVIDIGFRQSRSEEHTSELQSHLNLVCRLLLEKKKTACHLRAYRPLYRSLRPIGTRRARPRSCTWTAFLRFSSPERSTPPPVLRKHRAPRLTSP